MADLPVPPAVCTANRIAYVVAGCKIDRGKTPVTGVARFWSPPMVVDHELDAVNVDRVGSVPYSIHAVAGNPTLIPLLIPLL